MKTNKQPLIRTDTTILGTLLAVVMWLTATTAGAADDVNPGNQFSLRGLTPLDQSPPAVEFKHDVPDREPYTSNYVYQPPLIPHKIRHYELSLNANTCLSCHSFKNAREAGATKISVTHYESREGAVLSDVSPRRYFCLQCHVVQTDARELIANDFEKTESLQ